MSAQGLEGLDHTVQLTHVWINDLDSRLEWNDKARSYRLLKAVLHALRDLLKVNEAVDLGAQLPGLLRGAYYEQWRPATTPVKKRSVEDFLARVNKSFRRDPLPNPANGRDGRVPIADREDHGRRDRGREALPAGGAPQHLAGAL